MAKKKKGSGKRRRSSGRRSSRGGRSSSRDSRFMNGAKLAAKVLAGAVLGAIIGPALPEAVSGEAVGVALVSAVSRKDRFPLLATAVALEGMLLVTSHVKAVKDAQHAVAALSAGAKVKRAAGGGGLSLGGVESSIKGTLRTAQQYGVTPATVAAVA